MDRRKRFSQSTITVDNSMKTPDDGSAPILLYDGINDVYYRTTVKHIIMITLQESRSEIDKMNKRINDFEESMDKKMKGFMSDMLESNRTIINLVKAEKK
jgi:hypothetical protein